MSPSARDEKDLLTMWASRITFELATTTGQASLVPLQNARDVARVLILLGMRWMHRGLHIDDPVRIRAVGDIDGTKIRRWVIKGMLVTSSAAHCTRGCSGYGVILKMPDEIQAGSLEVKQDLGRWVQEVSPSPHSCDAGLQFFPRILCL